jgi:hypothetical protein
MLIWHCYSESDSPSWRVNHLTPSRIIFYITDVQESLAVKLGISVKEYAGKLAQEKIKTLEEEAKQSGISLWQHIETLSLEEIMALQMEAENDVHLETMETMTGKPLPETYVQAQLRYIKKFISAHKPEVREHLYSLGLLKSKKKHLAVPRNDEAYEQLLSWFLHCIDRGEGDFVLNYGYVPYNRHGIYFRGDDNGERRRPLWPELSLKISGNDSATGDETPFFLPVYYFPHFLKECISARVDDFSGEKEPAIELDICGEKGHEVWQTLFDGKKDFGELRKIPGFIERGFISKYIRECIDGCQKDLDLAIIKHAILTCKSLESIRDYPRLRSVGESILCGDVSENDTVFIWDAMSLWERMKGSSLVVF